MTVSYKETETASTIDPYAVYMGAMGCATLQRISSDSTHSTLMPLATVGLFPHNQAAVFRQTSEPCPSFVPVAHPVYGMLPQLAAVQQQQQQAVYGSATAAVHSFYAPAPLLSANESNASAAVVAAPVAPLPFLLAPPLPLNGSIADTIALNLNPNARMNLQPTSLPPAASCASLGLSQLTVPVSVSVSASGGAQYAVSPGVKPKPTAAAASGAGAGARAGARASTAASRKPPKSNRHAMDTSMTTVSSVADELAGVLDPLKHQPLVPLSQLLGSPTDNSSSDAAAQMHGGGAWRGDAPSHAPRAEPGSSEGCTTDPGICHFSAFPPNPNDSREAACEVPLYNPTGV